MNKSELTEALAQKQKLTNSEAAKIINTLLNSMSEALGNGDGNVAVVNANDQLVGTLTSKAVFGVDKQGFQYLVPL
jgi:hypothetical protein